MRSFTRTYVKWQNVTWVANVARAYADRVMSALLDWTTAETTVACKGIWRQYGDPSTQKHNYMLEVRYASPTGRYWSVHLRIDVLHTEPLRYKLIKCSVWDSDGEYWGDLQLPNKWQDTIADSVNAALVFYFGGKNRQEDLVIPALEREKHL